MRPLRLNAMILASTSIRDDSSGGVSRSRPAPAGLKGADDGSDFHRPVRSAAAVGRRRRRSALTAMAHSDPALAAATDRRRQPAVDGERRLETPHAAGAAGLAFAGLFIGSILLLRNQPSGASTAAEIRRFYLGEQAGRVSLVGVYLVPFSGIAFLWFIAAVRNLIGDREDRFFATVFMASGLLFVAMLFVAGGVGGALLAAVKFQDEPLPSQDAVVLVRSFGFGFLLIYAMKMAAVFMIVVSTIGMRLGVLPRWLVVSGFVAALVLIFNVSYAVILTLVFPVWVAALSLVILNVDRPRTSASDPR